MLCWGNITIKLSTSANVWRTLMSMLHRYWDENYKMKLALITKTLYLNNQNNNCNFPLHPLNLFWIMGWLFIKRWYNLKKTNKLKKKNKTKTCLTVREMHNVSLHFNPKYYCVLLTIRTVKENKYVSLWKHKKFLSQPYWKKNDSGCDAFINSIQWVWASKSSFFLEFISKIFLNPLY